MMLARRLLAAGAITAAVGAVTALPAVASAQQPADHAALAGPPVCVDATNDRADNTKVRLWRCLDHANQKFVIDDSHIKVKDTLS
jgi:hypothetical protein